ncbi:MBOAT family protein [Bradyrhizobium sp. AUGA SZCCT0176]|uniref:MBOAT family O-acyltransferase n=1 Tax=Bradyrhizobium sp. AUGA SZCCT0176 TaxID=2807664 RepID=UPI001BA7DFC0|nr:MBOAT family protein [Bradyrhizobium sp. AUGA SZCCT0176]MBR1229196.1 MBOAT family protein [Bradyrhizobium sp. AUGA SZCCT0176]
MSFHSIEFFFLLSVTLFVLAAVTHTARPWILVIASYLFYAAGSLLWLAILVAMTLLNFGLAKLIERGSAKGNGGALIIGVVINAALLASYKYAGFLAETFNSIAGCKCLPIVSLELPLGISFYVFESISYIVDVHRKRMPAVRRLRDYALFISFFPHLVAGPIVRAADFVPQTETAKPFDPYASRRGLELIAVGFFKKLVIADNLAPFVDRVFLNHAAYGGGVLWIACIAFAIQIYCDFSGYTDIARGIAKLLGFELALNFDWPYFSRSIRDFWRRWHISLSSWLRDYLYIPLGGNRGGLTQFASAVTVTWFLGGLWHGASWTFILWGIYHGTLVTAAGWSRGSRIGSLWEHVPAPLQMLIVFLSVVAGWVLFRAKTIVDAMQIWGGMLGLGSMPFTEKFDRVSPLLIVGMLVAALMHSITYRLRRHQDNVCSIGVESVTLRVVAIAAIIVGCFLLAGTSQTFIYFQF